MMAWVVGVMVGALAGFFIGYVTARRECREDAQFVDALIQEELLDERS